MVTDCLRTIIRGVLPVSLVCVLTLGFGVFSAPASELSPPGTVAADQSIAQAVVGYPPPPASFRPSSASQVELEDYGFPPRPDAVRAPSAFARWQSLVSVPRFANAKLQQTTIYNSPIQNFSSSQTLRNGAVAALSSNWSGYADVVPSGTFTANGSFVVAEWVLPRAQQAFGVCNGSWDYSSQWAGFDGVTSNDVLQAGTEADVCCGDCGGATQAVFYSSWIEWAPGAEVRVSVPPVRPGDLISVEVWFTTSPPFGHAVLANYTLQQSQAYAFNPPAGTAFAGDSAEWIVERPFLEGLGLSDLTNYAADQFNTDYAFNSNTYFIPGTSAAGTTSYAITMVCPPWIPSASCPSTTVLSTPYLYSPWALWFYDSPPALY